MKRFNHGMVLGKFMPPHKGHLYLINNAIRECEIVDVFICSLKSEPILGELRFKWLTEIFKYNDNVNIIWVKDENPQTPEEHGDIDDFYRIWYETVYSRVKELDVIYTSEEYGDEFAEKLGIKHILVDIDRVEFPISGTMIRNDAYSNWYYIPDVVKAYFKKKIVIMGPESTGKSILTKRLASHFKGDVVEEYGREYTDGKPAKIMDVSDFEEIATIHKKRIDNVIKFGSSKYVFIDTEAITTYLFGKMYLGSTFNSPYITDMIANQNFDLVLLCDIDVPWVDDGTRDFPNRRKSHFDKIKETLEINHINYVIVNGDYDERYDQAKEEVDKLIPNKLV